MALSSIFPWFAIDSYGEPHALISDFIMQSCYVFEEYQVLYVLHHIAWRTSMVGIIFGFSSIPGD